MPQGGAPLVSLKKFRILYFPFVKHQIPAPGGLHHILKFLHQDPFWTPSLPVPSRDSSWDLLGPPRGPHEYPFSDPSARHFDEKAPEHFFWKETFGSNLRDYFFHQEPLEGELRERSSSACENGSADVGGTQGIPNVTDLLGPPDTKVPRG